LVCQQSVSNHLKCNPRGHCQIIYNVTRQKGVTLWTGTQKCNT